MRYLRSIHGGFAAIAAIFLVLILAALGAFMVSFSNTQQLNSAQDMQGSRAYWAARAGLEWGVASHLAAAACSAASTSMTIEGFTVTVTCTLATYVDSGITPGVSPRIFQFTSTAVSAGAVGGIGYTERSVSTTLEI
jgi:MSHA biogenesis protein MshP